MVTLDHQARGASKKLANPGLMMAVVVFVVMGVAAEFFFLPKPSSSPGVPKPTQPVKAAVDRWVIDLNSRNVTGLGNSYAPNANVTWTGVAAGLTGGYFGIVNIKLLYGSSVGRDTLLDASIANYKEKYLNSSEPE